MEQQGTYEQVITPPGGLQLRLGEIWKYRELLYFLFWRDIKVKYKQTLLGFSWAVLQPLLVTLIFVFFFARTLKLPTDNIPAPLFYFSGLLVWNIFSAGVTNATQGMISNAQIIKKNYFPKILIPVSGVAVSLFDFFMAFLVYCCVLVYFALSGFTFPVLLTLGYGAAAFFLTVVATTGLSLVLSAWNAKYRDVRYALPFFIQLLFFLSPVIYPLSVFDSASVSWILALNPLTSALELARAGFTGAPPEWIPLVISCCSAIFLCLIGLTVFQRMEAYFADII